MERRIDTYIKGLYGIKENTKFEILELWPEELLTFSRLDIAAKIIYLEGKTDFDRKLYIEHIKAMTKGSYIEAGNPDKKSVGKFCDVFDKLKRDMGKNGYDTSGYLVPVDKNLQILDGAHRVATALFLKKRITVIKLDVIASDKYDYDFFEKSGMSQEYLDAIVLKYISVRPNIFIANIWPTAVGYNQEIKALIQQYGKFGVYKEVLLSEEGAFNYLHQIYAQDDWVGSINDKFSGVYRKLIPCFKNKGAIRVFVFEAENNKVLELKQKIRTIFQVGKHSVHITDTAEEALLMGNIIMALHGIREANDIDYLIWESDEGDKNSHNKYIKYYGKELNELIFDPRNYFYYQNHKYMVLSRLKEFKKNRNEGKDMDDLYLINTFLDQKKNRRAKKVKIALIRKKRKIITNIQGMIIRFTHKTGTYDLARTIYHKVSK